MVKYVPADKHLDAAKRYYRSSREEYSRQRRGISISRKDNRRREERILRVCMYTFIYCGILESDIHNLHRVLNIPYRSEKRELQLLRSVIYQNPPRPSGEK